MTQNHCQDKRSQKWILLLFGLLYTPQGAWADGTCNNICSSYMFNPDGDYSFNTWSSQDKVLCAMLGINTKGSQGVTPDPTLMTMTPVVDPNNSATTLCKIPAGITPSMLTKFSGKTTTLSPGDQCQWAQQMQLNCQQNVSPNSPLINACQAYFAIQGTGKQGTNDERCMQQATGITSAFTDSTGTNGVINGQNGQPSTSNTPGASCKADSGKGLSSGMNPLDTEKTLIALDTIASALCITACVMPANLAAVAACSGSGIIASAVELSAVIAMNTKSTLVSGYIQDAGSFLAFIGAGVAGAGAAGSTSKLAGKFGVQEAGQKESLNKGKNASCFTMVTFLALLGIRAYDLIELENSAKNQCDVVKKLANNGAAPSPNPSPAYTGLGDTLGNGGSQIGSSGIGGSGTGGGAGLTGSGVISDNTHPVDQCMSQQIGSGVQANVAGNSCAHTLGLSSLGASSGGDAGLTNQMGTGNLLSRLPDNINTIAKKISSEGVGSTLASLLPSSIGDAGLAAAAIAQAAQNDGANLASHLGMSGSTYSSGSGAGSRGNSSAADSALANIFGAGSAGALGGGVHGPALASFGAAAIPNDIWHSDSKVSLFDIVTDKILRVSNRVK